MPIRFAEVEPNILYRGGAPKPWEVNALKDVYGIEQIISLDKESAEKIKDVCKQNNINHIIISIEDGINDGLNIIKKIGTKKIIADVPSYVHCYHGKDRTGLFVAKFRIENGWDFKDAMKEAESFGFGSGVDPEVVKKYVNAVSDNTYTAKDNKLCESCGMLKENNLCKMCNYVGESLSKLKIGQSIVDQSREAPMDYQGMDETGDNRSVSDLLNVPEQKVDTVSVTSYFRQNIVKYLMKKEILKSQAQETLQDNAKLAEKLFKQKRYAEAATAWANAFKEERFSIYLYNQAICYKKLGNNDKAIALLEQYIQVDPNGDSTYDAKEQLYNILSDQALNSFKGKNYEQALQYFTKAYNIKQEPINLYNQGICYEKLGNRQKAVEMYNKYLETSPDNRSVEKIKNKINNLKTSNENFNIIAVDHDRITFKIPQKEKKKAKIALNELNVLTEDTLRSFVNHLDLMYDPFSEHKGITPEQATDAAMHIDNFGSVVEENLTKIKKRIYIIMETLKEFDSDSTIYSMLNSLDDSINKIDFSISNFIDVLDKKEATDFQENVLKSIEIIKKEIAQLKQLCNESIIDYLKNNVILEDWTTEIQKEISEEEQEQDI